ncbi:MAG: AAA family ATPase, partial [Thermoanaerobaculia bacterium]
MSPAPSVPSPSTPERIAAGLIGQLEAQVASVLRGKPEPIRLAVVCLLAKGHVLIADVPGVGKTTLAQALARSLGVDFQRIQFTSDLLPSDILGVSIYRQERQAFEFVRGPLFANVVLADEINRASPKTQSALLEAMSERQVSVDGQRLPLAEPFIVIATQNPLEYVGTFPLPESQLDRFTMSLQLGYPPRVDERELLLSGGVEEAMANLKPAISRRELLQLQDWVDEVRMAEKIVDYMLALAGGSRSGASEFLLGISTRALQSLYRAAQAMALCEGRSDFIPDYVQAWAAPVLAHRVALMSGDDSPAAALS